MKQRRRAVIEKISNKSDDKIIAPSEKIYSYYEVMETMLVVMSRPSDLCNKLDRFWMKVGMRFVCGSVEQAAAVERMPPDRQTQFTLGT